jgi:hypothetical protein
VGGLQKRLGCVGVWPEIARSWARPRWRVLVIRGDGSDGWGPRNREGAGERMGFGADEQGPRINERRRARADEFGADKSTPPGSEREREKRERARDSADMRGPSVREGQTRGHGRGLDGSSWAGWAELAFSFFL